MKKILFKISKMIPDKLYLRLKYFIRFHEALSFRAPKTFNEKLQWLKLHDRKTIYTTMVDKYEVKKYVADIVGEEYIIPTLGVYDKFNEISFDELPGRFVIKCTHDSGGLVICKDKTKMNKELAKEKIEKCLKRNYFYHGREWPYKNVKPRIIIEKYLEGAGNKTLLDYKLFCFNGKVELILVCSERFDDGGLRETWFSPDWELLDLTEGGHAIDVNVKKPSKLDVMKRIAAKLSGGIPFVRVDFYEQQNKVFFGEMTFYPMSGMEDFSPAAWNNKLGDLIDLELAGK